jgi:hypothetical protein
VLNRLLRSLISAVPPIEIAADQVHDRRRCVADQRRSRQDIVDHHGWNSGHEPQRGCEQRLGDAWRHDREIRRVRLRDTDETVHDAPDRAEQAHERRSGADRGQDAGSARDFAAGRDELRLQPRDGKRGLARCRTISIALSQALAVPGAGNPHK